MRQMEAYMIFNGNCEEALNTYCKVFNGKITFMQRYAGSPIAEQSKDGNKIMHASFEADGIKFMAGDTSEANGFQSGGQTYLCVSLKDAEALKSMYNQLSEGGVVHMPLQETFYSPGFGIVTDKFGIQWMFYQISEDKQ